MESEITPGVLEQSVRAVINSKQVAMVWGPPGIGKSVILKDLAKKDGYKYIDIRAITLDPVEVRGIPYRDGDVTRWAHPVFLPPSDDHETKYMINIEEITSLPPSMQAVLYQLLLDRMLGEYTLPDNAVMVACGNRLSDRGVVHRMSTALADRMFHLHVKVSVEDWIEWALNNDIRHEVIFFIKYRPDLLHQFNPKNESPSFPTPRGWEMISNLLNTFDGLEMTSESKKALIAGKIGRDAMHAFWTFLKLWKELPDPKLIIDDPENAVIPNKIDIQIALCGALAANCKDEDDFENIVAYAMRLKQEIGGFLVRICISKNEELKSSIGYTRWVTQKY